jgi:ATP-dependent 26S proteasome regulatory subunit
MSLSSCLALVRNLRDELQLLQEPGSYVGEVVKSMGKTKVLVKVCLAQSLVAAANVT